MGDIKTWEIKHMGYLKPGVYTKEIDLSDVIEQELDFPEFCEEMASAVSKQINIKHNYDVMGSNIRFWDSEGDILTGDVVIGVTMHTSYVSIYSGIASDRIEYTDKDIINKVANKIRDYLHNKTTTTFNAAKWDFDSPNVIKSQSDFIQQFGEPK